MNSEQLKSVLTTIVPVIGGILVSMGFMPQSVLDVLSGHVAELVGAIFLIAGFAYKIWRNRTAGVLTAAANLPEVKPGGYIKLAPGADPALAGASTPENVTR